MFSLYKAEHLGSLLLGVQMLGPNSVGPGSLTGWREDLKSLFPSSPDNHLSKGEGAPEFALDSILNSEPS